MFFPDILETESGFISRILQGCVLSRHEQNNSHGGDERGGDVYKILLIVLMGDVFIPISLSLDLPM